VYRYTALVATCSCPHCLHSIDLISLPCPQFMTSPLRPSFLSPFSTPLSVGRQELLTFIAGFAEELRSPVECSDLPVPLVLAMQDKTAVVRSLAENLLGVLTARALITKAALDKATRDLAPAAKRTLMPSIELMTKTWGSRRAAGAGGGTSTEEEYHEPTITIGGWVLCVLWSAVLSPLFLLSADVIMV
jgi:hypothetical protein